MIGDGRPLVAIVLEGDEGTGRGAVREGQSAFSHRVDDTGPLSPRPVGAIARGGSGRGRARVGRRPACGVGRPSAPGQPEHDRVARRRRRAAGGSGAGGGPGCRRPAGRRSPAPRRAAVSPRARSSAASPSRRAATIPAKARFSSRRDHHVADVDAEQLDADPGELARDRAADRRPDLAPGSRGSSSAVRPASASRSAGVEGGVQRGDVALVVRHRRDRVGDDVARGQADLQGDAVGGQDLLARDGDRGRPAVEHAGSR